MPAAERPLTPTPGDDDPLATSQRMLEREFRARAEAENQIGVVQIELAPAKPRSPS